MLERIIKDSVIIGDIEYFDVELTYILNRAIKHA